MLEAERIASSEQDITSKNVFSELHCAKLQDGAEDVDPSSCSVLIKCNRLESYDSSSTLEILVGLKQSFSC